VDFFNVDAIAATLADALQRRAELLPLRHAARATILDGYDQQRHCVPRLEQLLNDMAQGRLPPRQASIPVVTDGGSARQPSPSEAL
jgi:hypothetical protein